MHRHRTMSHGFYVPHPPIPCQCQRFYSPYEIFDPISISPCFYDCPCKRTISHCDCSYYETIPRPPIIQNNIHNDIYYYVDDTFDEDENIYRLSRSKIQLVDLVPKKNLRQNHNQMVVSTFQPNQKQQSERVILPRSTVVRNISIPSNQRKIKVESNRRQSNVKEIIPLGTVANSNRQTIKVRSLSPL